jgi:hypothetical protein
MVHFFTLSVDREIESEIKNCKAALRIGGNLVGAERVSVVLYQRHKKRRILSKQRISFELFYCILWFA